MLIDICTRLRKLEKNKNTKRLLKMVSWKMERKFPPLVVSSMVWVIRYIFLFFQVFKLLLLKLWRYLRWHWLVKLCRAHEKEFLILFSIRRHKPVTSFYRFIISAINVYLYLIPVISICFMHWIFYLRLLKNNLYSKILISIPA